MLQIQWNLSDPERSDGAEEEGDERGHHAGPRCRRRGGTAGGVGDRRRGDHGVADIGDKELASIRAEADAFWD